MTPVDLELTASWFPRRSPWAAFCHIKDMCCETNVKHTATTETGVLQLQVRSRKAAFQQICDKLTLTFNDLNGY